MEEGRAGLSRPHKNAAMLDSKDASSRQVDFEAVSPLSPMSDVRQKIRRLQIPSSVQTGHVSPCVLAASPGTAAMIAVSATDPLGLPCQKVKAEHCMVLSLNSGAAVFAFLLGALMGCGTILELERPGSIVGREIGRPNTQAGYSESVEWPADINATFAKFKIDVAGALFSDILIANASISNDSIINGSVSPVPALQAVLRSYDMQNQTQSINERTTTFLPWDAEHSLPRAGSCDVGQDANCIEATEASLQIDGKEVISIIVLLPGAGGTQAAASLPGGRMVSFAQDLQIRLSWVTIAVLIGLITFLLLTFLAISTMVLVPLQRVSDIIRKLQDLEFQYSQVELSKLQAGPRSRIVEVAIVQKGLDRFVRSLETFGRFMPLALARGIVFGDERSMHLHVAPRDVTVMSTDIKNFTKICEGMCPPDLLFMITHYLSVMMRVIDMYQGTVSEILGDGLLVFWNTPQNIADHASKACTAALAQHKALALLNLQLADMKFPPLAIRIGIHTGWVLSGNFGSETRMKFGCIGDPVNLANRLEGLCKCYEVGTICSAATKESISAGQGFVFRRLDMVGLTGQQEPTVIYEVMDKEDFVSIAEVGGRLSMEVMQDTVSIHERSEAARCYERALDAFQGGHFAEARDYAARLAEAVPSDRATQKLLQRANSCVDSDGHVLLSELEVADWTGVLAMEDT